MEVVSKKISLKVHPHYAAWHTAAHRGKVAQPKSLHAASICGRCIDSAATYCSMLRTLKIWSANCRSHQRKPRGIWWVRSFKMVSASLRKKSDKVHRSRSSFCNLKKVCKKLFFYVDAIALATYAEQLLPHGKAAVCCILPHDTVWTHL